MKTTRKMNVLLVAEEAIGVHSLQLLSKSDHILSGVLTTVDSPEVDEIGNVFDKMPGRPKKPPNSSVATHAGNLGIPVLDARQVQEAGFADWMNSHHIDVLLNVHSLYRICPEVLQAARFGAFNLHPGSLPAYSGLNVPSWAVYNEEPTHAVTIHHITDKIDTGDIVYETQFPLTATDTGLTVSITCAKKGLELIERLLNDLNRNPSSLPARPQDLSQRRFYKRNEIPGGGFIQWSEPAHKIDAFVRACNYSPFPSPWGDPKTRWGQTEISILKTTLSNKVCHAEPGTVGRMIDGKTAIATADHWILVDRCKVDGETVAAASFLTSGDILTPSF
jgi:methionyl-tRNA formyltransferase